MASAKASGGDEQDKEKSDRGLKAPSAVTGLSRGSAAGLGGASSVADKDVEKTVDSQGPYDTHTADEESLDPANDPLRQTDFSALYED